MAKKLHYLSTALLLSLMASSSLLSGCISDVNEDNKQEETKNFIGTTQNISGFYPWYYRDIYTCSVNQNFLTP